jgi:Big-like domain-containing protein
MKVRSCLPLMLISCGVLAVAAQTPSAPRNLRIGGASGIASRYPGDLGIENDPDVLFAESFEEATTAALFARWTDIKNGSHMSFSSDVPSGSSGSKSLNIDWVGGSSDGGHLFRPLSPAVDDTMYVRYYVKYPSSSQYTHSGIWMGGHNPSVTWPDPVAGVKPVGNDRFSAAAEQSPVTSRFDHYDYWMNMHLSNDGNFWGNLLLNDPAVQSISDTWMCVEQMVKLNNPVTASNGEHAIWRDGVRVSDVGLGFPNGSWSGGIFTQDPAGTPFGGMRWRSDAALNLNWIWLQAYAPTDTAGVARSMKFDHVVVAKTYVGCMGGSASSDVTPPTISITAPAGGATVSGSAVAVSMTAADDVAMAGVQLQLDGANVGAEDTATPYTTSWNSTSASNGSHTLTAIARDAAGNRTTSASRTVTVSNAAPPPGTWPNEPSGFTTVTDFGFDNFNSGGWSTNPGPTISTDGNAPRSPSNVATWFYPQGFGAGSSPGTVFYPATVVDHFVGYWFKYSNPYSNQAVGTKQWYPYGSADYFVLFTSSSKMQVDIQVPAAQGGSYNLSGNVSDPTITLGVWHRFELYFKRASSPSASDGIVRWWIDGALAGNYTNVMWPSTTFDELRFAPTWGGIGGSVAFDSTWWVDHIHVSKP